MHWIFSNGSWHCSNGCIPRGRRINTEVPQHQVHVVNIMHIHSSVCLLFIPDWLGRNPKYME